MSAITQFVQDVTLPAQFNVVRWIAGMQVNATDINGRLCVTADQMAGLLGVTQQNLSYHLNKVYGGLSTGELTQMGYVSAIYQCQISHPSGSKHTKFYDLEILLLIAERMENTPRKEAILAEGRAIVVAYHSNGFVVNHPIAAVDPYVIPRMIASTPAHHFTPLRQRVAAKSHDINWVFAHCLDAYNPDGSISHAMQSYFRRCIYNTTYLAVLGMTALQVRYTRANPNDIDFGLVNFRNAGLPGVKCIKTALNYMHDDELLQSNGFMDLGFADILGYKRKTGPVHVTQALQLYYKRVSTLSEFIPTPDMPWYECPETAIDNLVNVPDTIAIRAELRAYLEQYRRLLPQWQTLSASELDELRRARQAIVAESVSVIDDNGNTLLLT